MLDIEYDLLKHRGFQASDSTPSMQLLYYYGRYKKDREDARTAAMQNNARVTKMF